MKKLGMFIAGIALMLLLGAWGFVGHRTIGQIAFNHLTPQAKTAVQELLGTETMTNAATWADDLRNDPKYRNTTSWHFINVPLGLSQKQFNAQISDGEKENVYTALLQQEKLLSNRNTRREDRIAALKFVLHFVGDIHQPMHVGRAEDKGGNTIQVNFNGRGTNLHSLWDTGLLLYEKKDDAGLAEAFDHPSTAEIKQWQDDAPTTWAWESYQISTSLYQEIDRLNSRTLGEDYYKAHIGTVERRIEQAGIRLAGVLNHIFQDAKPGSYADNNSLSKTVVMMEPVPTIKAEDASKHIGETVKLCAKVFDQRDMGSFVLVNLGAAYPKQTLTIALRGEARQLAKSLEGQLICVTGKLIDYKGRPEIEVRDIAQIEK